MTTRLHCAGRLVVSVLLAATLVPAGALATDRLPTLRFNPFRAAEPDPSAAGSRFATGRNGRVFRPILISTVTGKKGGLANLGGELLAVGEERGGYRLLRVSAFDATFEHDGKTIRLEVTSPGVTP